MNTVRTNFHTWSIHSIWSLLACCIVIAASMALTAPWANAAPGGGGGKTPGPWVKLSGTVTSSDTNLPIEGATVTLEAGGTVITTMVTDANGEYSNNKVPIGQYTIETTADKYADDVQENVLLLKGRRTVDVSLMPAAGVVLSATVSGDPIPGASLTANGSYTILDGSGYISSGWSQGAEGLAATIGAGDNTTVELADVDAYAAHQIEVLKEPPLSGADLPPGTVLQPGIEGAKGLQDRNQVVAINPMAMEEGEALPLIYTVKTTSGTYTKEFPLVVALPWHISTGVRTVPVGTTVLLYAKEDGGYSWNINSAPAGSTAALNQWDDADAVVHTRCRRHLRD